MYRKVTGNKTAEEIETEIIMRRKEQVKNVVITDKDFEQFVYVNRAAQKWKMKLKKNKVPEEELKDILDEGNITVNEIEEVPDETENGNVVKVGTNSDPLICDKEFLVPATTVYDNGKFVTDV